MERLKDQNSSVLHIDTLPSHVGVFLWIHCISSFVHPYSGSAFTFAFEEPREC
jgi:hypothetical protein